jgi:hypothetical protein
MVKASVQPLDVLRQIPETWLRTSPREIRVRNLVFKLKDGAQRIHQTLNPEP